MALGRRLTWVPLIGISLLVGLGIYGIVWGSVLDGVVVISAALLLLLVSLARKAPPRAREVATTPQGLLLLAAISLLVGLVFGVLGALGVLGVVGTLGPSIAALGVAVPAVGMAGRLGAFWRTVRQVPSLLGDENVLVYATGLARAGLLSGGQVIVATDRRLIGIRSRLIRPIGTGRSIPYSGLAELRAAQDSVVAEGEAVTLSIWRCPPSQTTALVREVRARAPSVRSH